MTMVYSNKDIEYLIEWFEEHQRRINWQACDDRAHNIDFMVKDFTFSFSIDQEFCKEVELKVCCKRNDNSVELSVYVNEDLFATLGFDIVEFDNIDSSYTMKFKECNLNGTIYDFVNESSIQGYKISLLKSNDSLADGENEVWQTMSYYFAELYISIITQVVNGKNVLIRSNKE